MVQHGFATAFFVFPAAILCWVGYPTSRVLTHRGPSELLADAELALDAADQPGEPARHGRRARHLAARAGVPRHALHSIQPQYAG